MMAEPTLGARIMEAADHLADRTMDCDDGGIADANDQLRALCARADAAERLAVASSRYIATIDGQRAWTTGTDSDLSEALAAWRAITEEVTDG